MATVRRQGKQASDRRELVKQYMHLQRELIEGDPAESSYQGTIHAFRQMGYMLISYGMESDLDRLLRIRVIEGGKSRREPDQESPERPTLRIVH
ncbi:MAG TPA: hypothetical protein VF898_04865 [Chloroflexota bacterium]